MLVKLTLPCCSVCISFLFLFYIQWRPVRSNMVLIWTKNDTLSIIGWTVPLMLLIHYTVTLHWKDMRKRISVEHVLELARFIRLSVSHTHLATLVSVVGRGPSTPPLRPAPCSLINISRSQCMSFITISC